MEILLSEILIKDNMINTKKDISHYIELLAVLLTGAGKFLFFEMYHLQFWFIMSISFFWLGYILYILLKNKARFANWGFRRKGFEESIRLILPLVLVTVTLIVTYGVVTNKLLLSWHIFPSLLLYPIWGIAQQFLILGLVAGNLQTLSDYNIPKWVIIPVTALLFCLVHFPNYPLMGATFLLALVYTSVYLKYRNLWALGVLHGWLGSLFYYFVLGKDAWSTFINSI